MRVQSFAIGAIALAATLAGCGGGGGGSSVPALPTTPIVTTTPAPTPTPTPIPTQPPPSPFVAPQNGIYIAGGGGHVGSYDYWVHVLSSPNATSPTTTIDLGTHQPWQMTFDQYGYLYVASEDITTVDTATTGTIGVYAPGATTPVRTLQTGLHMPCGVAVDAYGTVYVAAGCDPKDPAEIQEYAYGSTSPTKVVSGAMRNPGALALDKKGDVFFADRGANAVQEIPQGAAAPQILRLHAAYNPWALAFDHNGNLAVQTGSSILTFAAADVTTSLTAIVNPTSVQPISPETTQPNAIATATAFISFGADGTLYAADPFTFLDTTCNGSPCIGPGYVTIYPPSSQTPTYIDNQPGAMSVLVWPPA